MTTLHLLGGARLEKEGARLEGEPVQRHRIATLALLTMARDARLPREKILALLWPEQAPRRARHLLNVTVHVLRKALGKEAIRSEGDDLRLDLGRVRCDAVQFREAVDRDDHAQAVDLYAGPFLDGFFLDGAPEFDQWQEARRRELERAYLGALDARATRSAGRGDQADAIACLRSIVQVRPIDAPATARLMELLEASGDIAGALRAAADHGRVMAETFEAEPSPEVERLAARIRDEPRPVPEDSRRVREGGRLEGAGDRPWEAAGPTGSHMSAEAASGGAGSDAASDAASDADSDAASDADSDAEGDPARGRESADSRWHPGWRVPLAVLAVVLIVVGYRSATSEPSSSPYAASVAVLPFADMSPLGDQAYFSDGLTEEILNALAQTPGLRVAARSSSFQFRADGVDIRAVGRRLGVSAIVEGSVRVDGDRIRITTQLIDADSGYHLWSEQYDRELSDVFTVQEEIARSVATALSAELAARLPDTLVTARTANPSAYTLYLRGRQEWRRRTEEGMRAAQEAFQEAVTLDPGYAAAYAGLADTWQLLPDYADVPSDVGLARAKTAALRAVALDSTLAEAHVSLAALLDDYDRDRAGAEAAYRRAIELNPNYATARHWFAIHLADDGRFDEALREIELARRLDPLSTIVNTAVGAVRYFARDYDGAVAEYRSVLDLEPDFALGWALLGRVQLIAGRTDDAVASLARSVDLSAGDPSQRAVYAAALAAAGRPVEARAVAEDVRSPHPEGYVPYCELASAYLYLGEEDEALRLFELAWEERDPALKHIGVEPLYDRIREHPDFLDLMRRAGLDP